MDRQIPHPTPPDIAVRCAVITVQVHIETGEPRNHLHSPMANV